jgi:hypothetical protein
VRTPAEVIKFPKAHKPRVIDCQGEGRTLSTLQGPVLAINPTGMDFQELLEVQAKERRISQAKQAWIEFRNAYAELMKASAPDDPYEHCLRYMQDMRGRRP